MLSIQFRTKKSVSSYVYHPRKGSYEPPKIGIFEILQCTKRLFGLLMKKWAITLITASLVSGLIQRQNRTYVDSLWMAKNRWIPNICKIFSCSCINWRVFVRTDFHIWYSQIFVFSKNLEVPGIYSAHNDEYREYTNTLIRTLLVRLFSTNVVGYSPRIYGCAVPPWCMSVLVTCNLPKVLSLTSLITQIQWECSVQVNVYSQGMTPMPSLDTPFHKSSTWGNIIQGRSIMELLHVNLTQVHFSFYPGPLSLSNILFIYGYFHVYTYINPKHLKLWDNQR